MSIHRIYKLFQDRFRPARMHAFVEACGVTPASSILDLGGTVSNWDYLRIKPQITLINLCFDEDSEFDNFVCRNMDATALPLKDNSHNVVFSNSVIEHVGDWEAQRAFAQEVRRSAPYYYVQTPNRWFFIEPHFLAPMIHFLPRPVYRRLLPFFSLWYWIEWPSREKADAMFDEIRLLTEAEFRELFPDAEIRKEKFLGMTKSFTAIRRGNR